MPAINKITSFNAPAFRGYTETYRKGPGFNSDNLHPASSIEKTQGVYHSDSTGKVYYAAPMEKVDNNTKMAVDYVIYDNEPGYPALEEVKDRFLGTSKKDLAQEFEEQRAYYYRREMGGFADVNEAKYHQWQSETCKGIYNDAIPTIMEKESLQNDITTIDEIIDNNKAKIKELESEKSLQEAEKNLLEKKQLNYSQKDIRYGALKDYAMETIERDEKEISFINEQIKKMKQNIAECSKKIKACILNIYAIDTEAENLNKQNVKLLKTKEAKTAALQDVLERVLKPMYEKISGFYKAQNIKSIKWR